MILIIKIYPDNSSEQIDEAFSIGEAIEIIRELHEKQDGCKYTWEREG